MSVQSAWRAAYRLRLKRRQLLWRALRSRHALQVQHNQTAQIGRGDILLFASMRNEARRLPYFLQHYRQLGVRHFLIVLNDSTDESAEILRAQPDVSVWSTQRSYREARFGMDWMNWLLMRYGRRHWCLTVDADELLVYPGCDNRALPALTGWLEARGATSMAAMMLDMYPEGPLSSAHSAPGDDPTKALPLFDTQGYSWEYQPRFGNISIRGGPRKRVFFAKHPERAPHLHKVPLIKWDWRYAYVSSTHVALPRHLNGGFDLRSGLPSGVLLHSKFLDGALKRAREEKARGEHFTHRDRYNAYYDRISDDPDLSCEHSARYRGPESLIAHGLMRAGDWT
jgi:hypothetical protein